MTQRTINDFFGQTSSGIHPRTQENTPERQVNFHATTPRILQTEPNIEPLPQAITKVINGLSTKYAAMFCSSNKITERINALQQHLNDGTIPPQMEYKFKKLFTKENESNLRSIMINATIDHELATLQSKKMELNALFNSRIQDLEHTISNPLNICNITFSSDQIVETFNKTLQERKLEFILKQNKDLTIKQAKREKFLARKEADNQIATLSTRQVNKFQKELQDLKSNIKKITISNSKSNNKSKSKTPAKSKNAQGGQAKSTGGKKKNSGKKKSTTRNN